MDDRLLILSAEKIEEVAKALSSPLRRSIIQLLFHRKLNILQIAEALQIHQSTCTLNVQMLEKAGLIKSEQSVGEVRGSQKLCTTNVEEVVLSLQQEQALNKQTIETEMPIGLFTSCDVHSPCGMVSESEILGYFDQPETFLDPQRARAQLIWLSHGYLEYGFPNKLPPGCRPQELCLKAEICSEFPGSNENWPSDITVWINEQEIGTWTSPGDMADKRGRLTPSWWLAEDSQYGFLKSWRVTREGSYIDGNRCSDVGIDDLKIDANRHYVIRIGIKDTASNRGGINLFGRKFGNYEQDLKLVTYLEN